MTRHLRAGLSLSASSGAITGTPTASGPYNLTVQVTDSQSQVAQAELDLSVDTQLLASGQVYSYTASYDLDGNVNGYNDSVMGMWSFSYDTLNRLISAVPGTGVPNGYAGVNLCMNYDAYGNRTQSNGQTTACNPASDPATASYNTANQVTWTTVNSASSGFQYDTSGDVTTDGANQYLYDGEGRVCAVETIPISGGGALYGYIYDAEGWRVANMKRLGAIWTGFFACLCAVQTASAANAMKPVALPSVEGKLVGAAFSPDSSRLAVIGNVAGPGTSGQRHILQIVELKSGQVVAHADVLDTESAGLATSTHFIEYSPDGRYLLLASKGSDVLSVIDATTLQTLKRIALHPAEDSRMSLGQGQRYFRGVVSLAGSARGDVFAVLTHDELEGNEVFVGSFSSGQIVKGWSMGKGRTATQLGQTSVSLSGDGSRIVVSLLTDENSLPKGFSNLRLYISSSGTMVKSIRTDGLVGQVVLLSDNILAARIDMPVLFSKKACIEDWSFSTGNLSNRFCDRGRNVSVALAASLGANRVAGFASQMHKSIEGQVYAASGRVDIWDMKSGNIIASSDEIPRLVAHLQISPNGEWIMADQMLFHLSTAP